MAKKKSLFQEFTKGILVENPVLRLVLGTCPTLAVSTSVESALGMGVAASIVLVCSNIAISALKKVIPQKVRIPAYIVIIASFVTIVQMLVKAFVPQIDAQLGVYLPLIVVNCIILGRAEAFACKNSVAASAVDGLGMGVGFTAALLLMGAVRELLGTGAIAGLQIIPASVSPMLIFILPPGGFFVFGILMACANKLADKKGLSKAELKGCEACPMAASCSLRGEGGRQMKIMLSILLTGILTENFILAKFLGICPFLGVSKKLNTAVGMSAAVIFVMLLATAVTYPINAKLLVPNDLEYLQTIVFILVIAALVQLVEIILKKYMPALYNALGIYLPLITTNCAVLGVVLINVENNYNFGQSMMRSLGGGLGFMLAMVMFAGVRERLESCDVPKFLQGLPITLIAASLTSVSFLGFSGVVDGIFG